MRSLFIVSLPRSLSSGVYDIARRSLALREPAWTSDGEILNVDQMAAYSGPRFDESAKFTTDEHDPALFTKLGDFLDQVVQHHGFAYKDVTQPFVVARWLQSRRDLNVLRLERPVTDVAFAMLTNRWFYPRAAASDTEVREQAVIEGLVRAERALAVLPGTAITFDELVADERRLADRLSRLYPNDPIGPIGYRHPAFVHETHRQLARRLVPAYRALDARVDEVRAQLASEPPSAAGVVSTPERVFAPWFGERLRRLVCEVLPRDATVVLVADGEDALLNLEGRRAWHLGDSPATITATLAHPGRLAAQLAWCRRRGGTHLVLPILHGGRELIPPDAAEQLRQLPIAYEDPSCLILRLEDVR